MTYKTKLSLHLLACLMLHLFFSTLFPGLKLLSFLPVLMFVITSKDLLYSLWFSCFLGLFLDLLGLSFFGIHTVCFALTTLFLHRYQYLFFDDKGIAIYLYAAVYSFLFTLIEFSIYMANSRHFSLPFKSILTNFIMLPTLDAFVFLAFVFMPKLILSIFKLCMTYYTQIKMIKKADGNEQSS